MMRGLGSFLRGNMLALIALFIALGGTTYAATALPKNSVGTKQLKNNAVNATKIKNGSVINAKLANNAVTGAKVKDDSLTGADILESSLAKVPSAAAADTATNATNATTAANATQLGGVAASAYQHKPRWAEVDADGSIPFQSGGITVSHSTTGLYFLDFGSPVTGMLVTATPGNTGEQLLAVPCGGGAGATNCSVGNDANHLLVRVQDSSGADTNLRFFVGVFG